VVALFEDLDTEEQKFEGGLGVLNHIPYECIGELLIVVSVGATLQVVELVASLCPLKALPLDLIELADLEQTLKELITQDYFNGLIVCEIEEVVHAVEHAIDQVLLKVLGVEGGLSWRSNCTGESLHYKSQARFKLGRTFTGCVVLQ
jgi:hypothetical protein